MMLDTPHYNWGCVYSTMPAAVCQYTTLHILTCYEKNTENRSGVCSTILVPGIQLGGCI